MWRPTNISFILFEILWLVTERLDSVFTSLLQEIITATENEREEGERQKSAAKGLWRTDGARRKGRRNQAQQEELNRQEVPRGPAASGR